MIDLKPETGYTPAVLSLATQFESLAARYHTFKGVRFDENQTVCWEKFINDQEKVDWREINPLKVFSLLRAKKERYKTLTSLGRKDLADALEEKYL